MKEIVIDVKGMPFGRAASQTARILMGKDNVDFAYNIVTQNIVIIENIEEIKIAESKKRNLYYTHSGYIGNLKKKTLQERVDVDIRAFFKSVVKTMLPDNKLQKARLKRLKIS